MFESPPGQAEYFRQSADLLTFAQSVSRYYDVRENSFAFVAAHKGPDYLRAQLDKARDFATLRDANQLLQSEGFYASFFFGLLARGGVTPRSDTLLARQDRVLEALATMFASDDPHEDSAHLIELMEAYRSTHPDELSAIADVFSTSATGCSLTRRLPGCGVSTTWPPCVSTSRG